MKVKLLARSSLLQFFNSTLPTLSSSATTHLIPPKRYGSPHHLPKCRLVLFRRSPLNIENRPRLFRRNVRRGATKQFRRSKLAGFSHERSADRVAGPRASRRLVSSAAAMRSSRRTATSFSKRPYQLQPRAPRPPWQFEGCPRRDSPRHGIHVRQLSSGGRTRRKRVRRERGQRKWLLRGHRGEFIRRQA